MLGILIISDDGNISVAIIPDKDSNSNVLLSIQFFDLELPPIPVPVSQLRAALEVWFGKA